MPARIPPNRSSADIDALPADVRLMRATAGVLYVLAAALFVAIVSNWLIHRPAFAVRAIRVEGEVTRNSASTIRANAAPKLAGNFFTTDLAAAKRAFESVPWVRQAMVSRVWPNRLVVRLEEHQAVAIWAGDRAGDRLVNAYGEVFQANVGDVEDDALPQLDGPDGTSAHMLAMLTRLKPVFARLDLGVDALTLSGRGSWKAELNSGASVELGRGTDDEVVARATRFVSTFTQVTHRYQRPLEHADLRHHDGYAIRLRGITTVIPKPGQKN